MKVLLALFFVWLGASAWAQDAQTYAADIASVERLGRDIYEHDRSAWLATDEMLADIPDPAGEGLRGWFTERQGEDVITTFVKKSGADYVGVYRGVLRGGRLIEHGFIAGGDGALLTTAQTRLFRARELAGMPPVRCAEQYNTVVLPRDGPDGIDAVVYLMPAQTQAGIVPMGGYHRVMVDVDAEKIVSSEPLSRSCMTLDLNEALGHAEGIVLTHSLSPTPNEAHVFIGIAQQMELWVATTQNTLVWSVKDGHVTLVTEKDRAAVYSGLSTEE